jgi:hypothetical protein
VPGHAQDGVGKIKAAAYDDKVSAGPAGQNLCRFGRRYDASQLAQHPNKKSAQ